MTKHKGYEDDFGNDRDDNFNNGEDRDHGDQGEHRGREDGNDDSFVHKFGVVDANAMDPSRPGQMYFGDGNLGTGYNLADNASEHVEVGLKVIRAGALTRRRPSIPTEIRPTRKPRASRSRRRATRERTGTSISAPTQRSAAATII